MSNPAVLTPDLTSEMVEFWGFKYKQAKQEVEDLQTRLANDQFLQDVVTSLRDELKIAQQKLEAMSAEKANLIIQVGRLNADRVALQHQASSLATEAVRQRTEAVIELLKPAPSFLDDSFNPVPIGFHSAKQLVSTLPRDVTNYPWQLYFIPQPPNAIPLRVDSPGQPGYWFYPFNLCPMDSPFELIVEVESNKWLYFGRYLTRPFQGYEMKLSEWLTLDEQTKMIFCSRVADHKLQAGQHASYATQIEIRQRYDTGHWNIPCYTLECVEYSIALYEAMAVAAAKLLHCEQEVLISRQSLGKRRRTPSSSCGFEAKSTKVEGSKFDQADVTQDGETAGVDGTQDDLDLTRAQGE
ncbi:Dolichyl-diphosphooligosaccharide--protein glycosyltransferase subunit WBP1 [Mycena venus]|uniref:Dolichyl-diphosphooligosaccharide--protein glycosyltransferase subunit WBP1 n=1 Tax=Mycena venus TaxID=2733690 RepID=A0A8H6Y405_9AGAR|nr:Dolichyl-diphosphooligosaccharide--protein glycosyltransferase subunit WBP1 [Mycena venus]